MKKYLELSKKDVMIRMLVVLSFFSSTLLMSQTTVMTYNLRYSTPTDGDNWWEYRKRELVTFLKHEQPTIVGVQEALASQVDYINNSLPTYNFVGVGRDDGKNKGEFAAIFYDTTKIALIETHTFWLSETPNEVSVGWDASMERICTMALFKNLQTNDSMYVYNSHFDHMGTVAREQSAQLLLSHIATLKHTQHPIIVIGDFNSEPHEKPIQLVTTELKDSYTVSASTPIGPKGTFNGFDTNNNPEKRIDYVMVKNCKVLSYKTLDNKRSNGLWLSDHLPVLVEIELK